MSVPEQEPTTATEARTTTELAQHQEPLTALYERAANPTRTTRAVSWTGWHLGELAGVSLPLPLGAALWDGFYVLSGLVALAWAAHETRLYRKNRTVRAKRSGAQGPEEVGSDELA